MIDFLFAIAFALVFCVGFEAEYTNKEDKTRKIKWVGFLDILNKFLYEEFDNTTVDDIKTRIGFVKEKVRKEMTED